MPLKDRRHQVINVGEINAPPETANIEAVRAIFTTNVLGTLAVTQAFLPLLKKSASARIVNVSSELGSLTHNGDPEWTFAAHKLFGYNTSKAAVNMLTVQLAAQLKPAGILVNSADPGFTATDLNGHQGFQTVQQAAVTPVHLALLKDDGPTGGFLALTVSCLGEPSMPVVNIDQLLTKINS